MRNFLKKNIDRQIIINKMFFVKIENRPSISPMFPKTDNPNIIASPRLFFLDTKEPIATEAVNIIIK